MGIFEHTLGADLSFDYRQPEKPLITSPVKIYMPINPGEYLEALYVQVLPGPTKTQGQVSLIVGSANLLNYYLLTC